MFLSVISMLCRKVNNLIENFDKAKHLMQMTGNNFEFTQAI